MGEIEHLDREAVIELLLKENGDRGRRGECAQYADAFLVYREASANIEKNGAVVLHPRTGAPIENPYLKIQALALSSLRKFPRLKVPARLW